MLYNTGTIAINGNTATGTGTNWTAPASQVRDGQTIIVMSNPVQMFQISSVNSATSMTVTPAASPALSGQKYGILVSDNISVDGLAQAMSQLIKEYDENIGAWETFATTSANQSITVTINGTPVTIPGIGKLAQKGANGALAITDGGTGSTTPEGARSNLGLGTSATRDEQVSMTDAAPDRVMMTGKAFGIGSLTGINTAIGSAGPIGFYGSTGDNWGNPGGLAVGFGVIQMPGSNAAYRTQLALTNSGKRMFMRATQNNIFDAWVEFYSTGNTTKASDGTLKAASPVARIVQSQEVNQRADVADDGFTWCGCGTANAEAEGISISRLDVGVYVLTGSAGLASEGWQLLPPMDPGGMGELGVVEAEQTESGGLTIRLFKRKYMLSDEGEIVKTKGLPVDVPANSWIDVRLDMPESSIWNQRQNEAVEPAS
ncbi:phage tail protein [Enterobacter ludwigii]|uniref:phage tail fiber protein n=1 Tax=Enterobacter ludwigii TaxID=299767 RepID=UPI002A824171|nr:phage tail protein [Enterobacter ludwigii]